MTMASTRLSSKLAADKLRPLRLMAELTFSSTTPAPTVLAQLSHPGSAFWLRPAHTFQMEAQDPRDFIRDIAVNFHGPYYLMRLLLPKFREQRSGCILNIASRAGTVAIPYSTSYCASKAAMINLTACTQKELDVEDLRDIHLYSLHPGGIKSTMTLKKYAQDSV